MSRKFHTADDEATRNATVTWRACLPPDPGARFIVDVITPLDLRALSAHERPRGGAAIAPDMLCGLLWYGYATGTLRARQMARASYASRPCPFLAGGLPPDHDPSAPLRTPCLQARQALLVPILFYAQELGGLPLGHLRLDGPTIPADASKSRALSAKRLLARDSPRRLEVDTLCALTAQAEQTEIPAGGVRADARAFRHERLVHLAKAQAVIATRAQERAEAAQAAYDAPGHARAAPARPPGSPPRGRPPTPPPPDPRDQDQDNVTAPASRLMPNSHNAGVAPHDQAQAAVAQDRVLLGAHTLATPPNDHAETIPTVDAIPLALGKPQAGALDHGDCSATTIAALETRDREPSIATGRTPHPPSWRAYGAPQPPLPPADASPKVPMADTRQTASGGAIDRLRTWTVAPVWGMLTERLGLRPCSLRGLGAAAGAWCLGCLACNVTRLHTLPMG